MHKFTNQFYIFTLLFFLLQSTTIQATHIIGGELYYHNVSANNYHLTLHLYRDCSDADNAEFDTAVYISVFDKNKQLIDTFLLAKPLIEQIIPKISSPCLSIPENVCVQQATYTSTINLPYLKGGYTLSYQTCCRNSTVQNIYLPDNTGATYTIEIPDSTNTLVNSSPVFDNFPPIIICNNEPIYFDHSAFDNDGDSLVYSLCTPFNGSLNAFQPIVADPPPYTEISWLYPYSNSSPIHANPPLSIDSKTGMITGTPNLIGQFVIGVCVAEYRNGNLLSTHKRDFQFNVTTCTSSEISVTANISPSCNYTSLTFSRTSAYTKDIILYLSIPDSLKSGMGTYIPDSLIIEGGQMNYQLLIPTYSPNYQEIIKNITITSNVDTLCTNIISSQIAIMYPAPLSITTNDNNAIVICKDEIATLTAKGLGGEGSYTYLWDTAEKGNTINVSPQQTTSYTVTVIDSCGNSQNESIIVYVICEVEIPNIFSPNGDGINDLFTILNIEQHPHTQLKIYDRWGRLKHYDEAYMNNWNGEALPEGTYYYKLILPAQETYAANEKNGFVVIVR